jgi:hypothetical protein
MTLQSTQTFLRENQELQQLVVAKSDTRFVPLERIVLGESPRAVSGRSRSKRREPARSLVDSDALIKKIFNRLTVRAELTDAKLQARARKRRVEMQNEETVRLNGRICSALSTATGVELAAKPQDWWQWWLDYNELYKKGEKPREYVYSYETTDAPVDYKVEGLPLPASCLAAGTTVWTDRGPIAVESVRVGDLALSKNPTTGELAYKPVLRTTIRPETPTHKVTIDGRSFQSTGGHTFWISGQGWMKIRDVKPGMRFHGATAPVALAQIESGDPQRVYNLVVADFHTYFVGPSMILSHDPTFAQPTDLVVPGLVVARNGH